MIKENIEKSNKLSEGYVVKLTDINSDRTNNLKIHIYFYQMVPAVKKKA